MSDLHPEVTALLSRVLTADLSPYFKALDNLLSNQDIDIVPSQECIDDYKDIIYCMPSELMGLPFHLTVYTETGYIGLEIDTGVTFNIYRSLPSKLFCVCWVKDNLDGFAFYESNVWPIQVEKAILNSEPLYLMSENPVDESIKFPLVFGCHYHTE